MMKNIVCISVVTVWFLGWSVPLLSAPCAMGCCLPQKVQKSVSTVSECRSHCGEDGCCSWKPSETADNAIQPAFLSLKYEDQKNPLYKTDAVIPIKEGMSKSRGIHLSRDPTLLTDCQIPSYLKHKRFLI